MSSKVFEQPLHPFELLGLRRGDPGKAEGSQSSHWENPPAAGARILLVEDDRSIRDALHGILQEEGYAVVTAENGRQALERLRSDRAPDLIVLDLRMPIMDGWQFRVAQKGDPVLAGIPVLVVSADGSAQAEAIDAVAYLRKPLSTDALLSSISRVLAEAERQRLLRKLEEAERFAALGRLAASVGHEINNPLAYVSMNIDLITDRVGRVPVTGSTRDFATGEFSDVREMLRECRTGLDRIRDIVKDLQQLSRWSETKRELFSVNELLDETLAMARNHVLHRATVSKDYGDIPPVNGVRSAIGQVMLNLVLNAAESLPEGRAGVNEIGLKTTFQAGSVIIEVRDTGEGISPQVLPHIFDPFFTTKSIGEGTGLGLAVSCRIVADHAGRIEVESEPSKGAVFRVTLPVAAPAPEDQPIDRPPAEETLPAHARILVIDDVPAIGDTIALALSEHDVTVVSRAEEAFELFAANAAFDVIFCDVLMPDIGGREVLERLKVDWPHLVNSLVFITGGAFTAESRELLSRCKQKVLWKPFSIGDLQSAVQDRLKDRAGGRN